MGVVIISFPLLLVPAPGAVPQHDSPLRAAGMTRRPELGRRNQRKSVAIGAKSIARWCIVSLHLAMSQRLDPTSINLHTRALSAVGLFSLRSGAHYFRLSGTQFLPSFLPPSPLRTYTLSLKLMNWVIRGNGYAITLVIIICFTPPPPLPPFGRSASLFRHQYLRTPLHVRGSRPTMHGTLGSFWGSASMLGLYNRIPLRRRN